MLAGCGGGSGGQRRVTIALDFTPNGVHAGIYAAAAKGFDKKHGVKLVIRQPSASTDSLKLLAAGRADLAIVDIHDLGLAREQGADIVGVGALVDRPLASVIAQANIARPRQLQGRRVGVTGLPSDIAVLKSMVDADGGSYARVHTVTIGFSAVPDLIAKKVDAATAFWNAEGVTLKQRGVHVNVFRADEFGAPRYPELVIATKRSTLNKNSDLIKRALAALGDGSNAARSNPNVALQPIVKASGADPSLIRAELAAVRPILAPNVQLDPAALTAWAAFDARFGILKTRPRVSDVFELGLTPSS
ncbi:MAG TPA: ABC transporter substrate-binding protein [Thermoleophilaceae bacterium]|nr:ABC transporter substrate-binding protein [Thermoleophilaceae bacterium]